MSFSALPVITDALNVSGHIIFGEAAEPEAAALAVRLINDILLEWSVKSIYNPNIVQFDVASNGTSEYLLGSAAGIITDDLRNPRHLHQVTAKSGSVIWPIPIRSFVDWDSVMPKNISGVPQAAFWDFGLDYSRLMIWPIPPGGYTIGITGSIGIPEITNAQSMVELPVEYREFLKWTLAVRLVPMLPPDINTNPKVFEYIERSMNTAGTALKRRNSRMRTQSMVLDAPGAGGSRHVTDGYMTWPGRAV